MTDDRNEAPRRARRALEDEAPDGLAPDDTAAAGQRGGRFLLDDEADAQPHDEEGLEPADAVAEVDVAGETPEADSDRPVHHPVASDHADVVADSGEPAVGGEVPALPVPAEHLAFMRPDIVEQIAPSAVSPASPPPADPSRPSGPSFAPPAAAASPLAGASADEAGTASQPADSGPAENTAPPPEPHKRDDPAKGAAAVDELATAPRSPWVSRGLIGVLVLALAGGLFWMVRQQNTPGGQTTITQSPSASAASVKKVIDDEALITPTEAMTALGSTWTTTQTLKQVSSSDLNVTCMNNTQGIPNSVETRQRVMTAPQNGLAALQRIDTYASTALAQQAYKARLARLSACDDIAAYLDYADAIDKLGDEAYSITLTFQNQTPQKHTVILARTGTAVQMLDVARDTQPVLVKDALPAVASSVSRFCGPAGGTCPAEPTTAREVPPPTAPIGWLAQSDMPRITPGAGLWSATQPGAVTTKGSQCENVTLPSVDGAVKSEQRSYILGNDSAAPEGFGVDQVKYEFKTPKEAADFAKKIGDAVDGCANRLETAQVSEKHALKVFGQDRTLATGRTFLVTQSTSASSKVRFRVAVASSGNRVTYLVGNANETFDFTARSWLDVSARAAQRITQTR